MAREMKGSGIEWIGEIPKEYRVFRLKHLLRKPLDYGANSSGIEYSNNLPRYIRITDITTDGRLKNDGALSIELEDASPYLLEDGDILFARSGATVGKSFIYYTEYGKAAFAGYLIRARLKEKIVPEYVYYYTCSTGYDIWRNGIFIQSTIQNISADKYVNLPIVLPETKGEQMRIVSFLKDVCTELDNVLEKTHTSIEEYKKLKQAVITQTVTKGIRGNREMKDSGVEWIGSIPIGWKLIPFRHVLKERQEKNSPIKSEERLSLSINLGVTLYAEKTTNLDRFKDDFEQYKLAYEGDLVMNSMNMIVGATGVSDYFGCVSPVYYTFYDELEDHVTAKYCEYIFRSKTMLRVLYSLGKGIYAIVRGDDRVNTCRLKVSKEDLKSIIIPVPPVKEQREIVNYLKKKCLAIDNLIAKKEQYLSEIENYKKSLIYEYVTGKKEVPQKYQA